jgi:peptidoglycan/xylan/chitin deacetylase (PgdA/CDA1 family)
MFEASRPFAFFDYYRVPYQVRPPAGPPGPVGVLRAAGRGRLLLWRSRLPAGGPPGRYELAGCTLFGQVARDEAVPALLDGLGRGWRPAEPVTDPAGQVVASVWRDEDGSLFLPFDPAEVMERFWSESYRDVGRSPLAAAGRSALLRSYYLARPALPRGVQLRLRQEFTRLQQRAPFPRWPVEDTLHDLYAWLFAVVAQVAGEPVPYLAPWPAGRSWALVLTHDVETGQGCADLDLLRGLERAAGCRSSWNFVGQRYHVPPAVVRALQAEGCEVGVHGLRHDGRDLGSRRLLAQRLPAMRELAARWGAVGFRAPSTQRRWELMPRLGFAYDSSYPDTDPYEPQPGGCCSYLPYFNQGLVELPITLPQDHTLFGVLGLPDADLWLRKARHLRERQAMVLVLTHPDYARDHRVADGYRQLLDEVAGDETAWQALPREVAAWWRQRAASRLTRAGGRWVIEGPAASFGQVRFAGPASQSAPPDEPPGRLLQVTSGTR